jgi:amino acid adenylation domain-containing protein/thioester reductase-like protein
VYILRKSVELYPLSNPQKGIWYREKFMPGTSINNVAGTIKINAALDYELLERAINLFIEKNDSIRLRVCIQDGEPKQYISKYSYKKLDFYDFSSYGEDKLFDWDDRQTRIPFELIDSDLFYFALFKLSDTAGGFYVKTHHLISDAWTMTSLIVSNVIEYYSLLFSGANIPNDKKPSYLEYIAREQAYLSSDRFIRDKQFWKNVFKDMPEVTSLRAYDSGVKSTSAARKSYTIPAGLSENIRKYCADTRISIFTFFLSILAVYISRIMMKDDMVIGTAVLNRLNIREKNTAGMFINTIPLRLKTAGTLDFKSFTKYVSKEWLTFLRHHEYPYDILIKEIRQTHKGIESPFDIVLSYQNARFDKSGVVSNYEGRWPFNGYQKDPLYIHLNDREGDGTIVIDYDYLVKLFSPEKIEYLHRHLESILCDALESPYKKICELELLEKEEKRKILSDFTNTDASYPKNKTVHQLFEEQAEKIPDNIALIFEDKKMTYEELNKKSNQLARLLKKKGVKADDIIAVMLDRSLELIIGIMAILKAGAAFLPIDPDYPSERIKFMLEDCKAQLILTQTDLIEKIDYQCGVIDIKDKRIFTGSGTNLENVNKHCDLAYVIYTSGSTGLPKGVMIEHKSIVNFNEGVKHIMDFSSGGTVLSITTVSFDVFIFEIFPSLLNGLKVVIANKEEQRNPKLLNELIIRHNVEKIHGTPSRIQLIAEDSECVDCFKNLKEIILGGEVFPEKLLRRLRLISKARIFNGYGPAEATVGVTFKDLTEANEINIGKPIINTKIYILDKHLNPVPIGVTGELYIGGEGLARGYLNRQELTDSSFIPNPFVQGEKIYRTGDLARWYPMGEIGFIGRTDHQVKIRGLRIELGEIESQLLKHEEIKKAVVVDKEDENGNKYLCAYYESNTNISPRLLRVFLLQKLPANMIPSVFMRVEKMPLSLNGKINRTKLPEPVRGDDLYLDYIAPGNYVEEKLENICTQLLGIEKAGTNWNFFEMGGDSLIAISMVSRIHKELDVELPMEIFYRFPTIKKLADCIINAKRSKYVSIQQVEEKEYYPVSSAQKRLFVLMQLENEKIAYNMPWAATLEGEIDKKLLEEAFRKIVERHEAFRTSFEVKEGRPVQKIHKNLTIAIDYIDANGKDVNAIIKDFVRPFDLKSPPLLRVGLINLAKNKNLLIVDMHHIIADGMSIDIMLGELDRLYNGEELPEIRIQYKDYSEWHNNLLNSAQMKKQEEYWLNIFSGGVPVLNLPADFPRKYVKNKKGGIVSFKAEKQVTERLKELSFKTGTTLYTILLAAYYVLLSKYSGQEDIVVGTPVAGRNHADLENVIGMFVNTLAMRNYPEGEKTFTAFLESVKKNLVKAFENQNYQFEELVRKLGLKRELNRDPMLDTVFILQNAASAKNKIGNLRLTPWEFEDRIAKFDLTLEGQEREKEINFVFEYCTELFKRETVKKMGQGFLRILEQITENPSIKLNEINVLTHEESNRVLYEFNSTKANYPLNMTVNQLFEEQAEKMPYNIAVTTKEERITYHELNSKSNQLAGVLRKKGIKPDDIIAIMINRSLEMIIGIMGVLKAGGAYLPIDPNYPHDRIQYMLKDSGAKLMLTSHSVGGQCSFDSEIIYLDDLNLYSDSTKNIKPLHNADNLIYVIYTSGSTGKPKGVMLPHKAIVSFISAASAHIDFSGKKILSKTTMCFDIFAFEIFLPLSKGLEIVLANDEEQQTPTLLNQLIVEKDANVTITTPSTLQLLMDDHYADLSFKKLTDIIIGGEILSSNFVDRIKRITNSKIYNAYGPSETTVYSTIKELSKPGEVNIGNPIGNTRVYILDQYLNPVPIGAVGELCIGGDALARGYLNRPDLNAKKFVEFPHIKGERIYRTGDLAKWLPNGELEFIGRMDNQVKIRGLRVELDEIKNQLLKHDLVREAEAIVREDKSDREYLCAYLVLKQNKDGISKELRQYLLKYLPDYMVPAYFVVLESIPLSPNGKVDRSKLPEPKKYSGDTKEVVKPRNEIEKKIASIWAEVLGIDEEAIGIDLNFFELGGDSLAIIIVQAKALKYNWGLTTQDYYKYQTIEQLSDRIQGNFRDFSASYGVCERPDLITCSEVAISSDEVSEVHDLGNIFLTGATGFLGIHILSELMEDTGASVFCLVRGRSINESRQRMEKLLDFYFNGRYKELIEKRIFIINGDITLDCFGLGRQEYLDLAGKVNTIIHTAALVKHYGKYEDFEKVNVSGTKRIIDFSHAFNKLLCHISTTSVAYRPLDRQDGCRMSFTEKDLCQGKSYHENVYIKSKFKAESLVNKAVNEGLNAFICRVGNLTGRYSDGHFQININESAFYNKIRSIASLGAASKQMSEMIVDLTPVDYCSKAIIKLVQGRHTNNRVFHVFNHNKIKVEKLIRAIMSFDIDVRTLNEEAFRKYVEEKITDRDDVRILAGMVEFFNSIYGGKPIIPADIHSEATREYLKRMGFEWPEIDGDYISKIIRIALA